MNTPNLDKIYIGTVVDNMDPVKLARVRVAIPGLTDGIKKEDLPWYVLKLPVTYGKGYENNNKEGNIPSNLSGFIIPDVGTEVLVEFPWMDIYHGLVIGRYGISDKDFEKVETTISSGNIEPIIQNPKLTSPIDQKDYTSDFRKNYPHSAGYFDKLKNWFRLDKLARTFEAVCKGFNSCKFKIDQHGNITIHVTGALKVVVEKQTTCQFKENVEVIMDQSLKTYVSGERIHVTDQHVRDFTKGLHYEKEKYS